MGKRAVVVLHPDTPDLAEHSTTAKPRSLPGSEYGAVRYRRLAPEESSIVQQLPVEKTTAKTRTTVGKMSPRNGCNSCKTCGFHVSGNDWERMF